MESSKLVDKTIVVYGKSASGKSVIIKNIMKALKSEIPTIFVVSPTEASNGAYSNYVDKLLIHYDLKRGKKGDFLSELIEWQEARSAVYALANKLENIMSLYKRIRTDEVDKSLDRIEKIRVNNKSTMPISKHADIDNSCNNLIIKLLKKHIFVNKASFSQYDSSLSEEEVYTLSYIDMNPKVLLILDDCGSILQSYVRKDSFRKIFYQARHYFITTVMSLQDDTDLPANLRKNVNINIFTQSTVAKSNFERVANGYDKQIQKTAIQISPEVFQGYRKLVYIDNDPKHDNFYHLTAEVVAPFKYGSHALNYLCESVRTKEGTIDRNNRFHRAFQIKR